jgi:homoserine O-acetyltransferase
MSLFDLGHGRGGIDQAPRLIQQLLTVIGVNSDRLFPLDQQRRIARLTPGAGALRIVRSLYGHDSFLVESEQLSAIVREVLAG